MGHGRARLLLGRKVSGARWGMGVLCMLVGRKVSAGCGAATRWTRRRCACWQAERERGAVGMDTVGMGVLCMLAGRNVGIAPQVSGKAGTGVLCARG